MRLARPRDVESAQVRALVDSVYELMTVGSWYWAAAAPGRASVAISRPAAESRGPNVDDMGTPF